MLNTTHVQICTKEPWSTPGGMSVPSPGSTTSISVPIGWLRASAEGAVHGIVVVSNSLFTNLNSSALAPFSCFHLWGPSPGRRACALMIFWVLAITFVCGGPWLHCPCSRRALYSCVLRCRDGDGPERERTAPRGAKGEEPGEEALCVRLLARADSLEGPAGHGTRCMQTTDATTTRRREQDAFEARHTEICRGGRRSLFFRPHVAHEYLLLSRFSPKAVLLCCKSSI